MKQIFLALLLLALVVLLVPSLRERAQPHLDRVGETLGERLEGPLGPVLNPYRRLRTQSELGEAVRELIQDRNSGLLRPNPEDFSRYMQTRLDDEDGLDAWGSPYILIPQMETDTVILISAGPDIEYETDDNVQVKIRYGTPAYLQDFRRRR